MLKIAGHELTEDEALRALNRYPEATVRLYDLGGTDAGPFPNDGVTLADIGRVAVLNPRLSGTDVAASFDAGPDAPWHRAPAPCTRPSSSST